MHSSSDRASKAKPLISAQGITQSPNWEHASASTGKLEYSNYDELFPYNWMEGIFDLVLWTGARVRAHVTYAHENRGEVLAWKVLEVLDTSRMMRGVSRPYKNQEISVHSVAGWKEYDPMPTAPYEPTEGNTPEPAICPELPDELFTQHDSGGVEESN